MTKRNRPLPQMLLTRTAAMFAVAILLLACGKKHEARSPEDVTAIENAGRVEAATESERAILESLDDLPAGTPRTVGGKTVTAEAPYSSASGARCRALAWDSQKRLACREEAGWYFVPDVFGTGAREP